MLYGLLYGLYNRVLSWDSFHQVPSRLGFRVQGSGFRALVLRALKGVLGVRRMS